MPISVYIHNITQIEFKIRLVKAIGNIYNIGRKSGDKKWLPMKS